MASGWHSRFEQVFHDLSRMNQLNERHVFAFYRVFFGLSGGSANLGKNFCCDPYGGFDIAASNARISFSRMR